MTALQIVNGLTILFGVLSLFLPLWSVISISFDDVLGNTIESSVHIGLMFSIGESTTSGGIGAGIAVLAWLALIGACAMTYLARQENFSAGFSTSIFVTLTSMLTWVIYLVTDVSDLKDLCELSNLVTPNSCELSAFGFELPGLDAVFAHFGFFCAVFMTGTALASNYFFYSAKSEEVSTQMTSKV
mmetsp:Transcript_13911/g.25747  ORF Transcript_13911/g.25747 Transcript_13911/m.25747 type:complete len:186 (+) Transcript_13911:76-633(+)|eukprot:CAMPEP_0184508878 /NCGR_PEP_ID=MMETSP0198_2-20121128/988_1 /TAXON_ID=1112570 /ORGANISM="Thraustochytrium sp., Strain LLF1b" /LENGTH=185 /DNA_ID=CAMNT_0026898677 /DNA_START=62 /DNA_END=615 /DNA_ORIENTATION=-